MYPSLECFPTPFDEGVRFVDLLNVRLYRCLYQSVSLSMHLTGHSTHQRDLVRSDAIKKCLSVQDISITKLLIQLGYISIK